MSKRKESAHDKKVREIANAERRKGNTVKADLPGYQRPDGIGQNNRIPDVQITYKNGREKIIEVETTRSMSSDKKQLETFRKSAGNKSNRTFEVVKTKKKS